MFKNPLIEGYIRHFEKAVAANPNDAQAYCMLGFYSKWIGAYEKALDCYGKAIEITPHDAEPCYARSTLLTNCPEPALRSPSLAVQDALTALRLVRERGEFGADWIARKYLGALAEAHAAAGDLDAAIEVQRSLLPYALTRVAGLAVRGRLRELESLRDATSQSSTDAATRNGSAA